jgi:hypothetical protein
MRLLGVSTLNYCKEQHTGGVDAILDTVPLVPVDSSPEFDIDMKMECRSRLKMT